MADFTENELSALRRAYARGVLEVVYDGKKMVYESGDLLLRRIRVIEASLAGSAGGGRVMTQLTTFNRD